MELTKQEKDLLDIIMTDKYANGAFCGMIFNDISKRDTDSQEIIDLSIKLALKVRIRAMELSK